MLFILLFFLWIDRIDECKNDHFFIRDLIMSLVLQKIAIIGCAGAGKTTLAKRLGSRFNLTVYHLDHYYWKPGWVETNLAEFKEIHQKLIDQSSWIIDGNQMFTITDRIKAAQIIIFLDMPMVICFWRVLYRWITKFLFNAQDSQSTMTLGLLSYVFRYNRIYRPIIIDLMSQASKNSNKIIFIAHKSTKHKEIEQFIARFTK